MEKQLRNRTVRTTSAEDMTDEKSAIITTPEQTADETTEGKVGNFSVDRVLLCVQFNVLLYATCFWIQQSCFPYFSKRLGADNLTYGYLQTAFAIFQLIGGPLFGRFGDLFGARAALTLSYVSGVLTYSTLAMSTSLTMLFLSRACSLFLACMQGSQMVITDIVPYEKRADYLGKLGLWYGIGMVLGPAIGGQITKHYSEEAAAVTAAVGSMLSVVLVNIFIPKHVKHVKAEDQNVANVFNLDVIRRLLKFPNAAFLLVVKIVVGVPIGVLQSVFSRVAMETFNLAANYNGMVMSYIGIVTMIVQGLGVGLLSKRYRDKPLMIFSAAVAAGAYVLLSQVSDIKQFCAAILPLIIGMTTMQVVIGAALTKAVPPSDTGSMVGLGMATNSLIRTVSPTLGGYMLEWAGFSSVGYAGAVICGSVSLLLSRY